MALTVFGTPITNATLRKRPEYLGRPELSIREIATATFELKNEDGKDAKAREYLEERRTKYAFEGILCHIYNATGDTIRLQTYCDAGDGFIAPTPYPMLIMNGQWGVYMKRGGGAVVYAVHNEAGSEHQVLFSYSPIDPGRCHTEVRQRDFYKSTDPWATFVTPLTTNKSYIYEAHEFGISSFASIGGTTRTPAFEGIITLTGSWSRYSYFPRPFSALIGTGLEVEPASATTEEVGHDTSMDSAEK